MSRPAPYFRTGHDRRRHPKHERVDQQPGRSAQSGESKNDLATALGQLSLASHFDLSKPPTSLTLAATTASRTGCFSS